MDSTALEESFYITDAVRWRRWLPWLHLAGVWRIALRPSVLLLATLLSTLVSSGGLLLAPAGPSPESSSAGPQFASTTVASPRPLLETLRLRAGAAAVPVTTTQQLLSAMGASSSWGVRLQVGAQILWFLIVSAVCGGTIARIAAADIGGRSLSARVGLQFVIRRLGVSLGTLLLLMGAALIIGGLTWIVLQAGRLPGLGGPLLGLVGGVPLFAGLALTAITGLACCWPLLFAAVNIDGTDAFDSCGRVYNYVWSRPAYVLWLATLTLGLSILATGLVEAVVSCMLHQSGVLVNAALGAADMRDGLGWWVRGFRLIVKSFGLSYFWSAVGVNYLLLRKSVDAAPLDQMAPDTPSGSPELPLVGVAAVRRRDAGTRDGSSSPTSPASTATAVATDIPPADQESTSSEPPTDPPSA